MIKPTFERLALVISCIILAGGMLPVACFAAPAPTLAPRNPALADYVSQAAIASLQSNDTHAFGLKPTPLKLSHNKSRTALPGRYSLLEAFPSSYDLRTQDPARLTAVRSQGGCGSCWAFASYGSLESCLLPGQLFDFSENHMKNTHSFDWTSCQGGNHWISTAYLARWSGPVAESSDPYDASNPISPPGLAPIAHVQRVDFLPDRADSLDNDAIKQAVMNYGAVYTTYYMTESSTYYDATNKAYYYNGNSSANHAVCIVGWDDNFDKSKFPLRPKENGAFIVRNSWGSYWGEAGYFYVSYCDKLIGHENAVFAGLEPASNYNQIYDYDPYGWVESLGYGTIEGWFANVFEASGVTELRAVSFYAASTSSPYEVYIYLDPTPGPVNPAGAVASKLGVVPSAGYQTIVLDSPVSLQTGQKFSVVVRLTTPNFNYPIPVEMPYSGYASAPTAHAGESYISHNGSEWTDITADFANANVCVKAFATAVGGMSVAPAPGLDADGPAGGPFTPTSVTYTITNHGGASLDWTASAANTWVSVSPGSGSLGGGESANVVVSLSAQAGALAPGYYSDSVTFTDLTNGGSVDRAVSLSAYANYEAKPASFSWVELVGGQTLDLADDGVSMALPLPFAFAFYEKPFGQLYVAANGLLGFTGQSLDAYNNTFLPNTGLPNNAVYPYWDDLNPEYGGTITTGVVGEAPNRRYVASWLGVPPYANAECLLTFQVVLCEGSDDILLQYREVRPDEAFNGAGRSATVGIENRTGTAAYLYSLNGSSLLSNGQAIRLTSRGLFPEEIKKLPDGVGITTRRGIVTRAFTDSFYIESDDRASGIRVEKSNHGIEAGMRANVTGMLTTNSDGERCIMADTVDPAGQGSVTPFGLTVSSVGGGPYAYDGQTGAGQAGLDAFDQSGSPIKLGGLNNIGMLVKVCGSVKSVGTDEFYLDDGSPQRDVTLQPGIRVSAPGLAIPAPGSFVAVTGVVSCFRSGDAIYRMLRVADQADILPLN